MNHYGSIIYKAGVFVSLFVILAVYSRPCPAVENHDWRSDWGLREDFDIAIDTEGYHFPVSIAFVPDPGSGPRDPLYFVTELRGKVKVVTNDRSVYTFAEDIFRFKPMQELPSQSGEGGLTGICLDPVHGYVFITFAYEDDNKVLRNNVVRFQSEPGTFSLEPRSMLAFTDIFYDAVTGLSHQIGPCQVYNDTLYVGVGDGYTVFNVDPDGHNASRSIDSVLGKILRMTLDGKPLESNPYYVDGDMKKARNYVWAKGLRNPFGLKVVNGRVFVADNGPSVDRFTEVREGEDCLWDGTNWSIGANSAQVFSPATGVAQLEFLPGDSAVFPEEYRGRFYLTLCGFPSTEIIRDADRGIVGLRYGFGDDEMLGPPDYLLKYRGEGLQMIVGLAAGPDGLYFLPLYPDAEGRSYVLKISYEKGSRHPYGLENFRDAFGFMKGRGCFTCHTFEGHGLGGDGPSLDKASLIAVIEKRITSPEYSDSVSELDKIGREPFSSFREARREVLETQGLDKVRTWITYRIMEPRFDTPHARMPNMGISERDARMIADYLLSDDRVDRNRADIRVMRFMNHFIPRLKYRYLVYSFALGISLSFLLLGGYSVFRKKVRR
ncbi:MAG: PQQ-dependent sugar dehydrogenase [Thermodesulfobacteriota bacterium]